eukprot:TRINITY_DN5682_c0_g1_i2.p1 TRINITY_DN5682_c0_g1~~TRINITY_DN5682_c0_g1_i2.p1  ORF type:complete len:977 (+),score=316.05 TRINITY_DN5682_c0_g1_i2:61-2931(+)
MLAPNIKKRKFGDAPVNYVAGLGRGAVGFTTRSDIGPARNLGDPGLAVPIRGETPMRRVVSFGQAPTGYVAGRGRGVAGFGGGGEGAEGAPAAGGAGGKEDDDRRDYSESNFDSFNGYSESLFGSDAPYEEDDKEADLIYDAIDRRMDSRRKARREELQKKILADTNKRFPNIREQFADVTRDLASLSQADWENIPEPGDYSKQNKRINLRQDRFTPVPDSLIESARLNVAHTATADPLTGLTTPLSGMATPFTDFTKIGKARDQVLGLKLDKVSDSVSGQTVVDPKGYLTDLNSLKVSSDAEVSDIKKARLLLRSVITTNPKHPPGWIAAARLEETAGKLVAARNLIAKACEVCPDSEDVWLEAARLNTPQNAKSILARAVRQISSSVKIWIRAAELESEPEAKKAVLRRGLEFIPNSVRLWKAAVELENPDDARIMLSRAVECVPDAVDLWLALARLESYENARVVLNNARQAIPNNPTIWITAAKLEEANDNHDIIDRIVRKAVKSMEQQKVVIDRDTWIKEAEAAEKSGSVLTCQAIVRATIGIGVEDQDRKPTWTADAEALLQRGSIETARAVFAHMLTIFPGHKSIWMRAAELEKQHGTFDSLEQLLKKAVHYCPQAEHLWLMGAKEKWLAGDVPGARAILNAAFAANPDSEEIWLAAVKLEYENNEAERARALLAKARERAGTARVWMKSATLERELKDLEKATELVEEALRRFPDFWKLWLMAAQIASDMGQHEKARDLYHQAMRTCGSVADIWLCAVDHEVKVSGVAKARSILEKARLRLPQNQQVWLKSIRVEWESGNKKSAQALMARALQEIPSAGQLWAYAIEMEARPQRKSKSYDALKRCHDDPYVFGAIARLFWADRKVESARDWFNRSVTLNPDLGDSWIYFYKFELQYGLPEQQKAVVDRCVQADPRHGELWCQVSKAIGNSRLKTPDILVRAASMIGNP